MTAIALPTEPSSRARGPGQQTSMMTLVVDDDPLSRGLLASILQKAGHRVLVAEHAEQAMTLFSVHAPDLVLMDVVLPGIDGCQAMREMKRARAPGWLPVILVSARDSDDHVLEGLRAGADDYLTKPFKLDHVLAKVRNTSRSLQLQMELSHSLGFTRVVMDHIADGLLCYDENGVVQTSNRAAERLFRYGHGELRGERLSALLPGGISDDAGPREPSARLFGTARRRDGTLFSVESQRTSIDFDRRSLTVMTLRDVTEQLAEERRVLNDAAMLRESKAAREAENDLARELLDRLQRRGGPDAPCVRSFTQAATGFSGDAVVAVQGPKGGTYVMLADATGHGLAAAISLVPALSVLHAMAARGCTLAAIADELNDKLEELLPVGRFLAAALLFIEHDARRGEVWVGGVPAVLMISQDGRAVRRFESTHFALGIVPSRENPAQVTAFSWSDTCQLVLCSDGVLEAEGVDGDYFGEPRLLAALRRADAKDRLPSVVDALQAHLGGLASNDDASVAIVDLS